MLASEPVSICGVDVAAPQQLRARNSQQKLTISQLKSIFAKQFTHYEVKTAPTSPDVHSCLKHHINGKLTVHGALSLWGGVLLQLSLSVIITTLDCLRKTQQTTGLDLTDWRVSAVGVD